MSGTIGTGLAVAFGIIAVFGAGSFARGRSPLGMFMTVAGAGVLAVLVAWGLQQVADSEMSWTAISVVLVGAGAAVTIWAKQSTAID